MDGLLRCRMGVMVTEVTGEYVSNNAIAALRVQELPASQTARDVGGWLLAEMPSSLQEVRVHSGPLAGLALEFGDAIWDLTVEISPDGLMLFSGEEIRGDREIDPFPFDAMSAALVRRISRVYAANDR